MTHFEQTLLSCTVHVALTFWFLITRIKASTYASQIRDVSFTVPAVEEIPSALTIAVLNLPKRTPLVATCRYNLMKKYLIWFFYNNTIRTYLILE